jgi:hypothetical protein
VKKDNMNGLKVEMRYYLMHFAIVGGSAGRCKSLAVLTVGDQGGQGVNIDALRAPYFDAQWTTRRLPSNNHSPKRPLARNAAYLPSLGHLQTV